jgi:ssDNA-binding Zn-finger/Zn-ribbon topoisomerase 1
MTKVDRTRGIVCSKCGHESLDVKYTRKRDLKIIRMRQCPKCKHRFVTLEKVVFDTEPRPPKEQSGEFLHQTK